VIKDNAVNSILKNKFVFVAIIAINKRGTNKKIKEKKKNHLFPSMPFENLSKNKYPFQSSYLSGYL